MPSVTILAPDAVAPRRGFERASRRAACQRVHEVGVGFTPNPGSACSPSGSAEDQSEVVADAQSLFRRVRAGGRPCPRIRSAGKARAGDRWVCWICRGRCCREESENICWRRGGWPGAKRVPAEDGPEKIVAAATGAVENENGVRGVAAGILERLAKSVVVEAEFWESFAGLKMEIVDDVIAFLRSGPVFGGGFAGICAKEGNGAPRGKMKNTAQSEREGARSDVHGASGRKRLRVRRPAVADATETGRRTSFQRMRRPEGEFCAN